MEILYSRMTLVSIPSTLVTIMAAGLLADCVKPVLLIAPAFFGRSITTYLFKLIEDPNENEAFILVSLMIIFSIGQVVSLESLFMKNLPRDVRGAMSILMTFFLDIAALAYNIVGGPVFDSLGPASPFLLVSIFDMTLFLLAILLGCFGYLSYPDAS